VENTSDSDWDKVELTLVSGRPISFIQDLYTPLYMPRPVVRPELYASLRREQGYIRSNMGALAKNSTGYTRFEKKLLALETKIEGLQAQVVDAKAKVEALRKDLEDYINKLDIE